MAGRTPLQKRVTAGKQWLDANAPTGYVFNMFRYHSVTNGPLCMVSGYCNQYSVMALAFKHQPEFRLRFPETPATLMMVREFLELSWEDVYALGFEVKLEEGQAVVEELTLRWHDVLTRELWAACTEAGRQLASVPKAKVQQRRSDALGNQILFG